MTLQFSQLAWVIISVNELTIKKCMFTSSILALLPGRKLQSWKMMLPILRLHLWSGLGYCHPADFSDLPIPSFYQNRINPKGESLHRPYRVFALHSDSEILDSIKLSVEIQWICSICYIYNMIFSLSNIVNPFFG